MLDGAQEYDSAEWDIGRGVVVPSLDGNGFGNAAGEGIVCYSTSTWLDDCRPIVGGGFECEVDATTVFVVYDETAWGECQ